MLVVGLGDRRRIVDEQVPAEEVVPGELIDDSDSDAMLGLRAAEKILDVERLLAGERGDAVGEAGVTRRRARSHDRGFERVVMQHRRIDEACDLGFAPAERREAVEQEESRDRGERRNQEEGGPAESVHEKPGRGPRERAPQREHAREKGVLGGRKLLLRQPQEENAECAGRHGLAGVLDRDRSVHGEPVRERLRHRRRRNTAGAGRAGREPAVCLGAIDHTLLVGFEVGRQKSRNHRLTGTILGGELTIDMLDLQYNPTTRFYTSPVQMRANNGFLIVDDFSTMRRIVRGISRVFRGEKPAAELSETARDYWINRGKEAERAEAIITGEVEVEIAAAQGREHGLARRPAVADDVEDELRYFMAVLQT